MTEQEFNSWHCKDIYQSYDEYKQVFNFWNNELKQIESDIRFFIFTKIIKLTLTLIIDVIFILLIIKIF